MFKRRYAPGDRVMIMQDDLFAMFNAGQKGKVWRVIDDGKTYLYQLMVEKNGNWYFPTINGEGVELCPKEEKHGKRNCA